jgi:hypothetical protein
MLNQPVLSDNESTAFQTDGQYKESDTIREIIHQKISEPHNFNRFLKYTLILRLAKDVVYCP